MHLNGFSVAVGTRRLALLALLLAAAVAAPAVSTAASRELRVAVGSFSGELIDPIHGGVGMSAFQSPMFDYLVSFDRDMNIVPALAQSWSVSSDGRTYRFVLREDVRWHDGSAFTSSDVVHHFKVRLLKGTAPYVGPLLAALEDVVSRAPNEVEFRLRKPWPDFLAHLTPGNTSLGAITPKSYSMKVGEAVFADRPLGTGPYRLIERVRGSHFRFEAHPHPFRKTPAFRYLRLILAPEESTRIAMLKRGDVDIIEITPDSIRYLEAQGRQILRIPDSFMTFIGFIGTWEPRAQALNIPTRYANTDVRRALSMAIDREAIVKYLLNGAGSTASVFPMFRGGYGWDEQMVREATVPYDPRGARALLARAGYARGLSLKLYAVPLPGLSWSATLAEVIADYWRQVGVDVEIVSTELGASLPIFYGRPDSALGSAFLYRTTRSVFPIGLIQNYVVAEGRAQFALVNWGAAYASLNATLSPLERETAYRKFLKDLAGTQTLLPLFNMDVTYAASAELEGWNPVRGWPSIGMSFEYFSPRKGRGP